MGAELLGGVTFVTIAATLRAQRRLPYPALRVHSADHGARLPSSETLAAALRRLGGARDTAADESPPAATEPEP